MNKDRLTSHLLKTIRPTSVTLSSDGCLIIVRQLLDDNATTVGRIKISKQETKGQ